MKPTEELADDYGFEIVESGINTLADVDMAAADLAAKVDCISNLYRQYRSTGPADRSGKSERERCCSGNKPSYV